MQSLRLMYNLLGRKIVLPKDKQYVMVALRQGSEPHFLVLIFVLSFGSLDILVKWLQFSAHMVVKINTDNA